MQKTGLRQIAENILNFVTRIEDKNKSNKNSLVKSPPSWCLPLIGLVHSLQLQIMPVLPSSLCRSQTTLPSNRDHCHQN